MEFRRKLDCMGGARLGMVINDEDLGFRSQDF